MDEDINLTRGDIINKKSQLTTEMSEANLDNEKYSTFVHHMKGITEEEAKNVLLKEALKFPRPIVVPKIQINEETRNVPVVVFPRPIVVPKIEINEETRDVPIVGFPRPIVVPKIQINEETRNVPVVVFPRPIVVPKIEINEETRNEPVVVFPRPIVVPKIEINEETRKVPVVVDMLDLDTESESSDVDDIDFSNKSVGFHKNIIHNISSYGTEEKKISINCRERIENMLQPSSNVNKSKQVEFFGDKKELRIVLKDCYQDYINDHNYCRDCDVVFTTYKAFEDHYITQHLKNDEEIYHPYTSPFLTLYTDVCSEEFISEDILKTDEECHLNNEKIKEAKIAIVKLSKAEIERYLSKSAVHNKEREEKSNSDDGLKSSSLINSSDSAQPLVNIKKCCRPKIRNKVSSKKLLNNNNADEKSEDSSVGNNRKRKLILTSVDNKTKQKKIECGKRTMILRSDMYNYSSLLPKLYTCDVCSEEFISEDILKTHAKCHPNNEKIKETKIAIVKLSKAKIERYLSKSAVHNKEREEKSNCDDGLKIQVKKRIPKRMLSSTTRQHKKML